MLVEDFMMAFRIWEVEAAAIAWYFLVLVLLPFAVALVQEGQVLQILHVLYFTERRTLKMSPHIEKECLCIQWIWASTPSTSPWGPLFFSPIFLDNSLTLCLYLVLLVRLPFAAHCTQQKHQQDWMLVRSTFMKSFLKHLLHTNWELLTFQVRKIGFIYMHCNCESHAKRISRWLWFHVCYWYCCC